MTKIYGKKLMTFIFKYIHLRRISIFNNPVGTQYEDKVTGGQLDDGHCSVGGAASKNDSVELTILPNYTDFVPVTVGSFNTHGGGFNTQSNFYKYPPYAICPIDGDNEEFAVAQGEITQIYNNTSTDVTNASVWLRALMVRRYLQEPIEFEKYMTD